MIVPMDDTTDEVARAHRIRDKLRALAAHGPDTFGASGHGWQLAPPLDEDAVRAIEVRLGVALPPGLRAFLREVAGGGAGPYYGVLPPERWDLHLSGEPTPGWAAAPCPWTPETPRDDATVTRLREPEEPFPGAITIADMGCANYVVVVVTGEARGRVMYVSLDGGAPYFPENADFLDWYERWCDELAWGYDHHWFGTAMPGDEATLASTAADAASPRRAAALGALFQLPAPGGAVRAAVMARLDDAEADVRVTAIRLAARSGLLAGHPETVGRLLADPDAAVRLATIEAVTRGPAPWHDLARAALVDADEAVVAHALGALSQAKRLGAADVVVRLADPRPRVRRAAVEAARMVAQADAAPMIAALLPLAEVEGDDASPGALLAIMGFVRGGDGTAAQLDAVFALTCARLARPVGLGGRTVEVHGLAALARAIPGALAQLTALTRHPDAFVRWEAASALASVAVPGTDDGDAAVAALRVLAEDETKPRAALPGGGTRSTGWTVGESARRALAVIEARPRPS